MILSDPFNQQQFTKFIEDFLPDFRHNVQTFSSAESAFSSVVRIGVSETLDTSVIVVKSKFNIYSRITLTNLSFKLMKNHSIYRALIVYLNEDETIWRLSLLTSTPVYTEGRVIRQLSNAKRHSYVLGTDVGVATAKKYLLGMGSVTDFKDLISRFAVETVNKDFYKAITNHFYSLVGRSNEKQDVNSRILRLPGEIQSLEDKQNYAVRLLGRILFLWFLKQKYSEERISLLPEDVFNSADENASDILHSLIEPIFFELLNKPHSKRKKPFKSGAYEKVPYLNGGLFEPIEGASGDFYDEIVGSSPIYISDHWFKELFATLNLYNFTIDENQENDVELSIDPEMLGVVFENLLAEINPETGEAARKSTGSYYTPRSVVNFMVEESLKHYFHKKTQLEYEILDALVTSDWNEDSFQLSSEDNLKIIDAIKQLKVIDPACGSGAFPMGLLQKLVWILKVIDSDGNEYLDSTDFQGAEHWFSERKLDYLRKRKVIRDVIFGVDIQPVAVEIAKLRCFLTLIVDQEIEDKSANRGIVPLPNLDFKFVCANSLTPLESLEMATLFDSPEIENRLNLLREKFFNTTDEARKKALRIEYETLIGSSSESSVEGERIIQLRTFNPLRNNTQSTFFDAKTMFGFDAFDIVIGNPPYGAKLDAADKKKYKKIYESASGDSDTKGSLNTYTLFIEMALNLLNLDGNLNFIVPISICSSESVAKLHSIIERQCELIKISSYSTRPQPIFLNAMVNTSILTTIKSSVPNTGVLMTKMYRKTSSVSLNEILRSISFIQVKGFYLKGRYPKVSDQIEIDILKKIFSLPNTVRDYLEPGGSPIFYRAAGGRYFKVITPFSTGSSAEKDLHVKESNRLALGGILSSNLFFWFYQVYSDNLNLKKGEINAFPMPDQSSLNFIRHDLNQAYQNYLQDIERNVVTRSAQQYAHVTSFKEYKIVKSKSFIDEIDKIMFKTFNLNVDELMFIQNYDLAVRLGDSAD